MPASFSSAWKNRTWRKFPGSPQRCPFGRKIQRGTRVRTWRRRRKFTIICDCFLRDAAKLCASNAGPKFGGTVRTKSPRAFCRWRRGGGFTFCTSFESLRPARQPFRNAGPRNRAPDPHKNKFGRGYLIYRSEVSTDFTRRDESTNFRRRNRFSMSSFRNPSMSLSTVWRSVRSHARASSTPSKFATAKGRAKPFSSLSQTARGIPPSASRSTNDSNARTTGFYTRNPSPDSSPLTIRTGRVRAVRGSATRSTST